MKKAAHNLFRKSKKFIDKAKDHLEKTYQDNEEAIEAVKNKSEQVLRQANEHAQRATDAALKTSQGGKDAIQKTYKQHEDSIKKTADGIKDAAEDISKSAAGTVIPDSVFKKRTHDIHVQSLLWRTKTRYWRARTSQSKEDLTDYLIVGGIPLVDILLGTTVVSDEIQAAFQLAYPNIAGTTSFVVHAQSMDAAALMGFISGIKGKLFEIRYVEYLNDGVLEDGYRATLAESTTNPGWDIAITGPNGELAQLIQAKATDSVAYVQEALERYPYIDVVSTSEVYNALMAEGVTAGLINSGISEDDLADEVMQATDSGALDDGPSYVPLAISFALIAFTAYKRADLNAYQKARQVGGRTGKSSLSIVAGYGLASLTGLVLLAPMASIMTRGVLGMGQRKYKMLDSLNARYENYKKANERFSQSMSRL